jgi:predicted nucleic acid-binding protein
MIAAIAIENSCIIATGNVRHFRPIGDLHIVDWIRGDGLEH